MDFLASDSAIFEGRAPSTNPDDTVTSCGAGSVSLAKRASFLSDLCSSFGLRAHSSSSSLRTLDVQSSSSDSEGDVVEATTHPSEEKLGSLCCFFSFC